MVSFKVIPYKGIDTLTMLIHDFLGKKCEKYQQTILEKKQHFRYLDSYFVESNLRTIIFECPYVDRDFLDDFAGYYVKCFHEYQRFCCRLHFFEFDFTEAEFTRALTASTDTDFEKQLKRGYLGFMVIKPLPETVIGRTCLKIHKKFDETYFPILRDYQANLFGFDFHVRSLPFQEQDKVIAACATSALWSVFHGTGKEFQHKIPSPVQITKEASKLAIRTTRMFPNNGLYPEEMAKAIEAVGLEPLVESTKSLFLLKSTAYAYLRGKIPIILGIELLDDSEKSFDPPRHHAVTIVGYGHCDDIQPYKDLKNEHQFLQEASRIGTFFVHDDQIGPFTKMECFSGLSSIVLTTSWVDQKNPKVNIRANPKVMIIPLYPKIRIRYETIFGCLFLFDKLSKELFPVGSGKPKEAKGDENTLVWDIYLTTANDFKREFRKSTTLDNSKKLDILQKGFPRFIWRASAYINEKMEFDLLFDATDIDQAKYLFQIIDYRSEYLEFVRIFFKYSPKLDDIKKTEAWQIFEELQKQLLPDSCPSTTFEGE